LAAEVTLREFIRIVNEEFLAKDINARPYKEIIEGNEARLACTLLLVSERLI
jgi:hypothetical protein